MKKYLIVLLLLCFVPLIAYAATVTIGGGSQQITIGGGDHAIGGAYCFGTLFCFQETEISWDADSGNLTDGCSGYDSDGDFCGQEQTTVKTGHGTYAIGLQGNTTYYVYEAIAATNEFWVEFWLRCTHADNCSSLRIYDGTNSRTLMALTVLSNETFIYYDNSNHTDSSGSSWTINTWYHYGVYYKMDSGAGDGIVRVYRNTTDSDFVFGDIIINDTAVDRDNESDTGTRIYLRGGGAGIVAYYDDIRVVDGEPAWPTS